MADNERSEDLNPRNKDIEEKVKQMLDPSIPDESEKLVEKPTESSASKISIIDNSSSSPDVEVNKTPPTSPPTAPELPSSPTAAKERKVIVPISHDDTGSSEAPIEADAPKEKKIAVTDHGESPEEVQEELNKAIAGLGDQEDTEPAGEDDSQADEPAEKDTPDEDVEENVDNDVSGDETTDAQEESDDEDEPSDEPVPEEPKKPEPAVKKVVSEKKSVEKIEKSKPKKPATDDIDDPAVDKAVKDIASREKDDIPITPITKPLKKVAQEKKKKRWLKLSKKGVIWTLVLLVLGFAAFLIAAPDYRYRLLNAVGVRASSSVTIKDITTGQPLPNATVRLGDTTATTNQDGYAELGNLALGDATLVIEKIAFATVEEPLTIGWGSNPLGDRQLTPTGVQFTIKVKDYLSGAAVASAVASRGDASANANENGEIKLAIPPTIENTVTITLKADGYRELEIKTPTAQTELDEQIMIPARKQTYIAPDKTIYSAYVDGSEKAVLLKPSGFEEPDLVLIHQPDSPHSAYISTRANNRNDQGNLTYNLLILNSEDGTTKNVALADQFIPHGWVGGTFVFTVVSSSDETAEKSKLQSYNSANGEVKTLATSSYFNDVHIADGKVFFGPSAVVDGGTAAKLYSINPDGSGQKTLFDDEVWKLFRNSYEQLAVSVQDVWYQYNLPAKTLTPLESNPDNTRQLSYVDGPAGKAVVVTNDGTLQVYTPQTRTSDVLVDDHVVQYPLYWFNSDTAVYRTELDGQLQTVAVSISTGQRTELAAVAETGNNDAWYFY